MKLNFDYEKQLKEKDQALREARELFNQHVEGCLSDYDVEEWLAEWNEK